MTNADDICAELAAARAYITRGDYQAALEAIDQAVKVWSAERDYWADIERQAVLAEREPIAPETLAGLASDIATIMNGPLAASEHDRKSWAKNSATLVGHEMPVRWGRRTDTGGAEDGNWREHGIA